MLYVIYYIYIIYYILYIIYYILYIIYYILYIIYYILYIIYNILYIIYYMLYVICYMLYVIYYILYIIYIIYYILYIIYYIYYILHIIYIIIHTHTLKHVIKMAMELDQKRICRLLSNPKSGFPHCHVTLIFRWFRHPSRSRPELGTLGVQLNRQDGAPIEMACLLETMRRNRFGVPRFEIFWDI